MADYNSSLPVRTETNGDVASKIVDATTPSQGLAVDTGGRASVRTHGVDPAAVQRQINVSEGGDIKTNGFYNVTTNTLPSSVGVIAHTRNASPGVAQQLQRLTAIQNSTVTALDVALRDEAGAPYSTSNPLPVTFTDGEGTEVNDYNTVASVAAAATSNHDYTVGVGQTFTLTQIEASGTGKMKIEVQVETATNVFSTRFVQFNSTANTNMSIRLTQSISVAASLRVRIIRTNLDKAAFDVFSTISGQLV